MSKSQPQSEPRLPHSLEAEKAVLGAILLNGEALRRVEELAIRPEDFFFPNHRAIFAAAQDLDTSEQAVDTVTITDRLHKRGKLEAAGGAAYISQLTGMAPRISNVLHYAKIVRDKAILRQTAYTMQALQQEALAGEEGPKELLDRFEQSVYDLRDYEAEAEGPISIADAVDQAMPQFEKMAEVGKGVMLGCSTGFPRLDRTMAGLVPGEYVIVGARPSQGKTALSLRFCQNLAQEDPPQPSAIFSLETDKVALLIRLACMHGEVDGHKMRAGMLSKPDWGRFIRALAEVRKWPIYIHSPVSLTSTRLVSLVRRLAERKKVRLVTVDYIQLLRAPGQSMREQVSRASQDLQRAARILGQRSGGTLVVMSQLTRAAAKSGEPELEDLRESGELEQHADTVLFLYPRGKQKVGENMPVGKWLKIAKQRNGPTGRIEMVYLSQWLRFEEAAPKSVEEREPEPEPEAEPRGEELPF